MCKRQSFEILLKRNEIFSAKHTLNTSLIVKDLLEPWQLISVWLTGGRVMIIKMAEIKPIEPIVQNGTPKPPILYKAEPMLGPKKRFQKVITV